MMTTTMSKELLTSGGLSAVAAPHVKGVPPNIKGGT